MRTLLIILISVMLFGCYGNTQKDCLNDAEEKYEKIIMLPDQKYRFICVLSNSIYYVEAMDYGKGETITLEYDTGLRIDTKN
jgi:thioredoxin-related protein